MISTNILLKILVSKKEQCGKYTSFKYFLGYSDNDVIRPLYLELLQMTGEINKFDEDKNKNKIKMSPKVKDKQLLKNYNKIWKKIERLISIDFDSKPTYDKYIKISRKIYKESIATNFIIKKDLKKYLRKMYHTNVCQ